MNWDDLRIIAAVKDEGTYTGASARLRIDETTVARRLARMQRALGVRLFEAIDGVRRPTPQCEQILVHVQQMAAHAARIGRIGEDRPGLGGRFRIATTSGVAEGILAPRTAALLARNPALVLQFLTSSDNVKFSRGHADIAIRLRKPERGDFTIAKLADIRLYLVEPAEGFDTGAIPCCYPPELDRTPESHYLAARGLQQRSRCITDSLGIIRTMVRGHQAVGILPEYACEDLLSDRRLRLSLLPRPREAWLLVQHHLKQDRAARAVTAWIREGFRDATRG